MFMLNVKCLPLTYIDFRVQNWPAKAALFYSTPTIGIISKDLKANFESKVSAIGGTMGLFTGFSVLSGIEILYHLTKCFLGFLKTNIGFRKEKKILR